MVTFYSFPIKDGWIFPLRYGKFPPWLFIGWNRSLNLGILQIPRDQWMASTNQLVSCGFLSHKATLKNHPFIDGKKFSMVYPINWKPPVEKNLQGPNCEDCPGTCGPVGNSANVRGPHHINHSIGISIEEIPKNLPSENMVQCTVHSFVCPS